MKSDIKDLEKRGYVSDEDIKKASAYTKETLLELLQDTMATNRTIAATHLSSKEANAMQALVIQLQKETCLYVKLAICSSLEKGNVETATYLVKYLGKIGHNQYSILPVKVSAKKSYPLPRDIIARTLAKMDIAIFPVLLDVLQSDDRNCISEVLDAIGFMVFYHPTLATLIHARYIYQIFKKYKEDDVLIWKALLCLSAFPLLQTVEILQDYSNHPIKILQMEAKRSLQYMP